MSPIKVVLDGIQDNPPCKHGPTVLFRRVDNVGNTLQEFYSCSASRDGKCSFHVVTKSAKGQSTRRKPAKVKKSSGRRETADTERAEEPTRFLQPLSNDGNEAQYFFSDSTLSCFGSILRQLKITRVLCMGAPRLHEYLRQETSIQSLLLDLDDRFRSYYDNSQFLHYNMLNHHFFDGEADETTFRNFLKNPGMTDTICIFTDPPFACRTELLAHTIEIINRAYNEINSFVQQILPTFWIFPYFMETYIQQQMPSMEMSDYQVNYTNHKAYHEKGSKNGSPVRMFTNVPLGQITLPVKEGYKYCGECRKSVHKTNLHCRTCKKCCAKNGATYRHCPTCNLCVKPNYKHCNTCGRCAQIQGHECALYQLQLTCQICLVKGHPESKCSFWVKYKARKRPKVGCRICGDRNHTVADCLERKSLLNETYFLGNYENSINSET